MEKIIVWVDKYVYIHPNTLAILTFRPAFSIVIFIHYKPRIAVAIFDL